MVESSGKMMVEPRKYIVKHGGKINLNLEKGGFCQQTWDLAIEDGEHVGVYQQE